MHAPQRTVDELERLASILESAQERGADVEEVKEEIRRELPGLGPALAKLLIPRTPADLVAYLTLILIVVGMVLDGKKDDRPINVEVDQVINNITVQAPSPSAQPRTPSPAAPVSTSQERSRMGPKIGRNQPCPCGSGKKYKKCHGDPIREQQQSPPSKNSPKG